MKTLNELYPNVGEDIVVKSIQCDPNKVKLGDVFVCIKNGDFDGHDYINQVSKKASCIIVDKDIVCNDTLVLKVPNTNMEYPFLCQKFYDFSDTKLKIIGVTGTDGKTCVSSIIQSLIGKDSCAYLGTNGKSCFNLSEDDFDTDNIFDDFYEFNKLGCKYASIEVSSLDIINYKYIPIGFNYSIYTNITSEHLSLHNNNFDEYFNSKMGVFKQTRNDGYCIINRDDPYFEQVKSNCVGKVLTYGRDLESDLKIINYNLYSNHTEITINLNGENIVIDSPLLGEFNVYNLCSAILCLSAMGFTYDSIKDKIKDLKVDGRVEFLNTKSSYKVLVDYCHTPNSILNLFNYIKGLDFTNIITVIGYDNDLDIVNRSIIGKIVYENSNKTIFTTVNNNKDVLNDLVKDINEEVNIIENRRLAISTGINELEDNSLLIILGKGNKTIDFNDIEEAYNYIAIRSINNN